MKNEVLENLEGSYFYEDRRVSSTRKSKSCDICGSDIPVKSSHLIFKLYNNEYYDFDICNHCETNEQELLNEIRKLEN